MKAALLLCAALLLPAAPAAAGEVRAAVASNFTAAAKEIARAFAAETGHRVILSFGATGQLFTQITQGAPFDVFLAADRVRPARAVDEGYAVAGTQLTYATGRLVLYSREPGVATGPETLKDGRLDRLAIANPLTAPYGAAAVEAMEALGVAAAWKDRIVQGTNIAQTYQFVATGNAAAGFVALSQVAGVEGGSRWLVPAELHTPIAQDAVLLAGAADPEAARAFLDFLMAPEGRAIVARYGYD